MIDRDGVLFVAGALIANIALVETLALLLRRRAAWRAADAEDAQRLLHFDTMEAFAMARPSLTMASLHRWAVPFGAGNYLHVFLPAGQAPAGEDCWSLFIMARSGRP